MRTQSIGINTQNQNTNKQSFKQKGAVVIAWLPNSAPHEVSLGINKLRLMLDRNSNIGRLTGGIDRFGVGELKIFEFGTRDDARGAVEFLEGESVEIAGKNLDIDTSDYNAMSDFENSIAEKYLPLRQATIANS